MSGCCVNLGDLGQKNTICLASAAGLIQFSKQDLIDLPNGKGSVDVLDALAGLGAAVPVRPWLVHQIQCKFGKVQSITDAAGKNFMDKFSFCGKSAAFDEEDCQYNNCQFGRWLSHLVRALEKPDRHLERNHAVRSRILDALQARAHGGASSAGASTKQKKFVQSLCDLTPKAQVRVSERPSGADRVVTLAGLDRKKNKLKPANYYRRRAEIVQDLEAQAVFTASKQDIFSVSGLQTLLQKDPKRFKKSWSTDELRELVVELYMLGLVLRDLLRVRGKAVENPACIKVTGKPLPDCCLFPFLNTWLCNKLAQAISEMHSHNVRICHDQKVRDYLHFLSSQRTCADKWYWVCWLASFNGFGVTAALQGPGKIRIGDSADVVAQKLWKRRDVAVVPCSVRHGPNKFEHYGMLQAVADGDFGAYSRCIAVAMERTASVHLAQDLAAWTSVSGICQTIAMHQHSTTRVKALEDQLARAQELLQAERGKNKMLRRELKRKR